MQISLLPEIHLYEDMSYREKLIAILNSDLNFHSQNGNYAAHNFHAFPAKFPPQLPGEFIRHLTTTEDIVLDPMSGSGTSILEACLEGRKAIGLDIDPLAILLAKVKTTPLDKREVNRIGQLILKNAVEAVTNSSDELQNLLDGRFDRRTKEFVAYWFAPETQLELMALISEIEKIDNPDIRDFFELIFSSLIITKSGGVSLALDLAHTRPHKVKVAISSSGAYLFGEELESEIPLKKRRFSIKKLRSALSEFKKGFQVNYKNLLMSAQTIEIPHVSFGNAQHIPLADDSIDLIITSPPYASNAIDYMRAHKFSLVWFGKSIGELSERRKEYIGAETTQNFRFEDLPLETDRIVEEVSALDRKKGLVLHRYYSEMTLVLKEMYRILKPGKAAVLVVGTSILRGRDSETQNCLAEIGASLGFDVPGIGVRSLDRNRRMMPAGKKINYESQIQQRMHQEYVIGFLKPKE